MDNIKNATLRKFVVLIGIIIVIVFFQVNNMTKMKIVSPLKYLSCVNDSQCHPILNGLKKIIQFPVTHGSIPSLEEAPLHQIHEKEIMHLAVVCCGARFPETMTVIKSVLFFVIRFVKIHIFTEDVLKDQFIQALNGLPADFKEKFAYQIHDVTFPNVSYSDSWRNEFKPCALQRIFFADLLGDITRLVYVDTDVLFVSPLDELWALFSDFDSVQIAGIGWHSEDADNNPYLNYNKHPIYGQYGLNTGVVLMDLPRMRAANVTAEIKDHYAKHKNVIRFGDQDLFNIYFHYHPDLLFKVNCKYNYRVCHCMGSKQNCIGALKDGVSILHGTRGAFRLKEHYLGFYTLHDAFESYHFEQPFDLVMRKTLDKLKNITIEEESCKISLDMITKRLVEIYIEDF